MSIVWRVLKRIRTHGQEISAVIGVTCGVAINAAAADDDDDDDDIDAIILCKLINNETKTASHFKCKSRIPVRILHNPPSHCVATTTTQASRSCG